MSPSSPTPLPLRCRGAICRRAADGSPRVAVSVARAFQPQICPLRLKRVVNHGDLAALRDGCVVGAAVPADDSGFESADVGDVLCVLSDLVSGAEQSTEVIPLSGDECIACTFRESDRDCDIFG